MSAIHCFLNTVDMLPFIEFTNQSALTAINYTKVDIGSAYVPSST